MSDQGSRWTEFDSPTHGRWPGAGLTQAARPEVSVAGSTAPSLAASWEKVEGFWQGAAVWSKVEEHWWNLYPGLAAAGVVTQAAAWEKVESFAAGAAVWSKEEPHWWWLYPTARK